MKSDSDILTYIELIPLRARMFTFDPLSFFSNRLRPFERYE